MARLVFDGNYHVYWLPASPANANAPTVAEINAGVELTAWIPKDGFNPGVANSRVDGGDLSTTFKDQSMGTWTSQLGVTAYRDSVGGSDTAYTTLSDFATGAIVVCPFAAKATGVKAYVWPDVQCGERVPMPTAENAKQKFTADIAVRAEPKMSATVA
jgi:hypothetical protein